jgi:acetolactate synthase-1/2/3 large subunit
MSGGEAAVQSLRNEGVEIVFGLPGVQIMSVYDAFYGRKDIGILTVRHEQSAAYMADGYARVTGKPGVALVAPGPGVQNTGAALGTAYAVSSPVMLLAGQVESYNLGRERGALHEINDQLDIVRPVTKWCRRVSALGEIPSAIHEGFRQMRYGRPRPVEVEIPVDILDRRGEVGFVASGKIAPQSPDREGVRAAAELLRTAKKPLVYAGGGVISAGSTRELLELAEAMGSPVATTTEGKGAFPEDHRLALGVAYCGHGAASWAAPKADVILAVGTRLTDMMIGLTAPRTPQKLIHMDVDPAVIGRNFPAEIALVTNARMGLKALIGEMGKDRVPARWSDEELDQMRGMQENWLTHTASHQYEILRNMQQVLDDDAVIVSGLTNVAYWSYFGYTSRLPRTYLTSSYFATLGYSFPLALGAKMGAPGSNVISLTGDGGFMYGLPELATAVRYGIAVVAVVFVDNALGASKHDQHIRYQDRVVGTELRNPPYAEIARQFGARGIRAEPDRLDSALEEALAAQVPTVIEVPIDTWAPPFQIPPRRE